MVNIYRFSWLSENYIIAFTEKGGKGFSNMILWNIVLCHPEFISGSLFWRFWIKFRM